MVGHGRGSSGVRQLREEQRKSRVQVQKSERNLDHQHNLFALLKQTRRQLRGKLTHEHRLQLNGGKQLRGLHTLTVVVHFLKKKQGSRRCMGEIKYLLPVPRPLLQAHTNLGTS
jgi:hypothetical protein